MVTQAGIRDYRRMAAGAVLMFLVMLLYLYVRPDPAVPLATKAMRVETADRMRVALSTAAEAEKGAVMAVTDEQSRAYADQARAAITELNQALLQMEQLLKAGGTPEQRKLLEQFSVNWAELQKIDGEILTLAERNTNIKAYQLAYGPAAREVKTMDEALLRIMTRNSAAPQASGIMLAAASAQAGVLRILALIPPHIAEPSSRSMDDLEEQMTRQDQLVRQGLDTLAAMPQLKADPDLEIATAGFARLTDLRKQILLLSRENTNVISLALSMDQKRKALFVCQDALAALKQAILAQPIPGVDYGRPSR